MRMFWEKTVKIGEKNCKKTSVCLWRLGAPLPDPHVVTLSYDYNFVEFVSSTKCVLF